MDIGFMQEQLPLYTEAAKITIYIALIGIVCSILLGMICSIVRYFRIPVLSWIVSCYIELSRNTPLLIQLFFLYFGLPKAGIVLTSEACAIIGLTFQGGSYMAEVFRSGLENVSTIQKESALALGMKKSQVLIHIILPQALGKFHSCNLRKYDLPDKGNFRIFSGSTCGSDVCDKRSDRNIL